MDISVFWRLYDALPIPPSLLRRVFPVVIPFLNLRIPLALYSSRGARSHRILLAGEEKWTSYLLDRIFKEGRDRTSLGSCLLCNLRGQLRKYRQEADLTIVRIDHTTARYLGDEYLMVPEWIGTRLGLPLQFDELVRSNASLKTNLRLIRRTQLSVYEGDKSDQIFEKFYYQMYVPFIRARHGKSAVIKDFYRLRKSFQNGGLLILHQQGRQLGGMLYESRDNRLISVALGALSGEESWMRSGGNTALIRGVIRLGEDRGFSEIDFGGCRPFLNDGLLSYKRRWGMQVCRRQLTYFDLLFYWARFNEPVHSFLFENPLIVDSKDGFAGLTAEPLPAFLHRDAEGLDLPNPNGIEKVFILRLRRSVPLFKKEGRDKLAYLPISDRDIGSSAKVQKLIEAACHGQSSRLS